MPLSQENITRHKKKEENMTCFKKKKKKNQSIVVDLKLAQTLELEKKDISFYKCIKCLHN